jgi:hypothetical protein
MQMLPTVSKLPVATLSASLRDLQAELSSQLSSQIPLLMRMNQSQQLSWQLQLWCPRILMLRGVSHPICVQIFRCQLDISLIYKALG